MIKRISVSWGVNAVGRVKTAVHTNLLFQLLLIISITVLAAILRFYMLGKWSFWGDEYITVERAKNLMDLSILRRSPSLIGVYLSFKQFGVGEWSARLVPAILGVATVPIFFWLVRKLINTQTAFIASVLLAIAPWHIYWSQNARFYTALLLFYTLSLLLFYMGIEEDKPWYLVLSLVFFAAASSERLVAAFLLPATASYLGLVKFGPFQTPSGWRWRNLTLFFMPAVLSLLILTFLNPSVQNSSQGQSSFGFANNSPFWILGGVVFYLGIPLVCAALAGAISSLLRVNRLGLFLTISAAVPLLGVMAVSLFLYSANRYVFVSLTSIVLLAAIAVKDLMTLNSSTLNARILAGGVTLILLIAPMADNFLYYKYQNGNRDNWKAAFDYIDAHSEEGDQVITTHKPLADYYLRQETVGMQMVERSGLADALASENRVWIVLDLTASGKSPAVFRWARENAHFVTEFSVYFSARTYPMEIYLYDPKVSGTVNTPGNGN
ncbi:MAG: glycosyltransferase family 39 protein [Ardenticatenaceae bacterium]|nr:glycosyltransferase family 39 protein [Ardenticatenaceae bacterium]